MYKYNKMSIKAFFKQERQTRGKFNVYQLGHDTKYSTSIFRKTLIDTTEKNEVHLYKLKQKDI